MKNQTDPIEARAALDTSGGPVFYYSLESLQKAGAVHLDRLPFSIRVLLENVLRNQDGRLVTRENLETATQWSAQAPPRREIPFMPARVLMQDLTGEQVLKTQPGSTNHFLMYQRRPQG